MSNPHRTRVKICGITSVADALLAVEYGCDAIGLVFYAPSPRYVTAQKAAEIVAALPPFISAVGLFVDASANEIKSIFNHRICRINFFIRFFGNTVRASNIKIYTTFRSQVSYASFLISYTGIFFFTCFSVQQYNRFRTTFNTQIANVF